MAKIALTPLIASAHGRFGGPGHIVFKKTKTGGLQLTSRSTWRSRTNETLGQALNRLNWKLLDLAWQRFSHERRVAWAQCVHRSYRKPRSGLDEFRSVNLKRMHLGMPAIFTPPDMAHSTKIRYPHAAAKGRSIAPPSQVVKGGLMKNGFPYGPCEGDLVAPARKPCLPELVDCAPKVHHYAANYFLDFLCFGNPPRHAHWVNYHRDIETDADGVEFISPQWGDNSGPHHCPMPDYPGKIMTSTFESLGCNTTPGSPCPPGLPPGFTFNVLRTCGPGGPRSGKATYYKQGVHGGPDGFYRRYYWPGWENWCPSSLWLTEHAPKPACGNVIPDPTPWKLKHKWLHFDLWYTPSLPGSESTWIAVTLRGYQSFHYDLTTSQGAVQAAWLQPGEGPLKGRWVIGLTLDPYHTRDDLIFVRNEWAHQNGIQGIYDIYGGTPYVKTAEQHLVVYPGKYDYDKYSHPSAADRIQLLAQILALIIAGLITYQVATEWLHSINFTDWPAWASLAPEAHWWGSADFVSQRILTSDLCNPHRFGLDWHTYYDLKARIELLAETRSAAP